jgi:hypothetical protein
VSHGRPPDDPGREPRRTGTSTGPSQDARAPAAWGGAFEGALEAGLSVAIGAGAGYGADRWLGTFPICFIVLLILGGVAGVRRLMQIPWPSPPGGPEVRGPSASQSRSSADHTRDGRLDPLASHDPGHSDRDDRDERGD